MIIMLGSGLGSGYYLYEQSAEENEVNTRFVSTQELISYVKILKSIWLEGDYNNQLLNKKINCQKYTGILSDKKLKCNPKLLICFLENHDGLSELSYSIEGHLAANRFKELDKNNFLFTIKKNIYNLRLSFKNSCRETFLPKRIYTMEDSTERKYSWWDSLNRSIFIDKYLVTNFDVYTWLNSDQDFKATEELLPNYSEHSFDTALGLRADEMQRYCQFHGKQLLTATYLDSASMHPGDYKNNKPKYPIRSKWPWSRKSKVGPVYEKRKNSKLEIKKEMCQQVYSKECHEKYRELSKELSSPSWTGIFQVLGSEMEYLENHVQFKKNLKASSRIFLMASPWNELGKRAFWDGTYYGPRSFNFRLHDPKVEPEQLQVGFRCYREIF